MSRIAIEDMDLINQKVKELSTLLKKYDPKIVEETMRQCQMEMENSIKQQEYEEWIGTLHKGEQILYNTGTTEGWTRITIASKVTLNGETIFHGYKVGTIKYKLGTIGGYNTFKPLHRNGIDYFYDLR